MSPHFPESTPDLYLLLYVFPFVVNPFYFSFVSSHVPYSTGPGTRSGCAPGPLDFEFDLDSSGTYHLYSKPHKKRDQLSTPISVRLCHAATLALTVFCCY